MQSVLLTIGMLLLGCAGGYFQPASVIFPVLHIPAMPIIYWGCLVLGGGLVIEHQRKTSP